MSGRLLALSTASQTKRQQEEQLLALNIDANQRANDAHKLHANDDRHDGPAEDPRLAPAAFQQEGHKPDQDHVRQDFLDLLAQHLEGDVGQRLVLDNLAEPSSAQFMIPGSSGRSRASKPVSSLP